MLEDEYDEPANDENMASAINNLCEIIGIDVCEIIGIDVCEIIGIDLGTKNTVVAVMKNGKIEVIPTPEGII